MKITPSPQTAPPVARQPLKAGAPITLPLPANASLAELDAKVRDGEVSSYSQVGDQLILTPGPKGNVDQLKALQLGKPATGAGLLQKATSFLVPPNMEETCAPEYARLRFWQVTGGVIGGALGYCGASTLFNAQQASFPNGAGVAMAGAWNSYVGLAANTAASMTVARMGDVDPKRVALYSGLWSTANTFAQYGAAAFLPNQQLATSLALNVSGAFSGNLGGSAGTHVANHLVVEHARGVVGAINGNQDRFAGLLGTPLGIAVQYGASQMGWNATMAPLAILGGALLICNVQQINAMRFERVDRAGMENLVGALLDNKEPAAAPESGLWSTVKAVFSSASNQDGKIQHLRQAQPLLQDERINLLGKEDYLVGSAPGEPVKLVFRSNCSVNSLIRGTAHALMLGKCQPLRAAAEELAPGKSDLLLTELSYRALPGGSSWKDELSLKGWHIHPRKLDVGTEDRWRGQASEVNAISAHTFSELLEKPDADALRTALQGSPLLSKSLG